MRLLNVETLKLEPFYDRDIPPYAILSHTWGDDEVTFSEIESDTAISTSRISFKRSSTHVINQKKAI
jgi:hypothetical protein